MTPVKQRGTTIPKRIAMTYALAMAMSRDAGNCSMRAGRRTVWAVRDRNIACETFARLWSQTEHGQLKPNQAGRQREGRSDNAS